MNQKLIVVLGVPILGAALVVGVGALRSRNESTPAMPEKAVSTPIRAAGGSIQAAPPPPPPPKLAPEKTIAGAMDEARLRTTYQNFRTALATKNRVQADALYPILLRDRKAALRIAEGDLSQATKDFDRTVAQQAVDALRR